MARERAAERAARWRWNPSFPDQNLIKEKCMIIEIRAAEGGEDAKLLVEDQVTIYARVATRRGL
jgi:protein subunit release factor A